MLPPHRSRQRGWLRRAELVCVVLCWAAGACLRGADLDTIGVTMLRQTDPDLAGSGIRVAQVEAPTSSTPPLAFEVNPSSVGQAADVFTYVSSAGTAADYPNSVGGESLHADGVGRNFFGAPGGVAWQIGHVDNYEAGYFFNNLIAAESPPAIAARVVNQSFIFVNLSSSDLAMVEQEYDNYAANGHLAACSTSAVDNVEHIFLAALPAGRYDLQVLKGALNQVSASETYALAFAFLNLSLSIALTNDSAVISWPLYPAGFNLWSATNPVPPAAWSLVNATVRVLNGQNSVAVPAGAASQFFRLAPP